MKLSQEKKNESSKEEKSQETKAEKLYKEALDNLKQSGLNDTQIELFIEIAKKFYEDIEDARLGIWDHENLPSHKVQCQNYS